MTHLFGYSWTTINGVTAVDKDGGLTEVARTWSIGLSGVTGDEIAQGLKGCIELGEKWPPGLPQFVKMCQKAEKPVYYQRLPYPPRTDEQKDRVRNILQEAKEMLR